MPKTKTPRKQYVVDAYLERIRRFPLKTIKDDGEHEEACEIVSELMGRKLDPGSADYLDALLVLLNKYEDEHHGIDEKMSPRQAMKALMEFNAMTQAQIGRIVGSESAVSMFLSGTRDLSKTQIKKLARRFKIDPMIFM